MIHASPGGNSYLLHRFGCDHDDPVTVANDHVTGTHGRLTDEDFGAEVPARAVPLRCAAQADIGGEYWKADLGQSLDVADATIDHEACELLDECGAAEDLAPVPRLSFASGVDDEDVSRLCGVDGVMYSRGCRPEDNRP